LDRAEILPVAPRHFDDLRLDAHQIAVRQLGAGAAFGAPTQRDLIAAAAFVGWSPEHGARHGEQRGIVIDACVAATTELAHGFAKEREGLRRHLEAQDMATRRRLARCRW
jgi:hypothetical protein